MNDFLNPDAELDLDSIGIARQTLTFEIMEVQGPMPTAKGNGQMYLVLFQAREPSEEGIDDLQARRYFVIAHEKQSVAQSHQTQLALLVKRAGAVTIGDLTGALISAEVSESEGDDGFWNRNIGRFAPIESEEPAGQPSL